MVRRIAHTAQHRGEMTALLRLLGRQVHSVYGPSVDTGGLPDNSAPTIYAYPDIESLIAGESRGGAKTVLPGPGDKPSTARPDRSMEPAFRSSLYDRPDLYHLVFPAPDHPRAEMCGEAVKRHLPLPPASPAG